MIDNVAPTSTEDGGQTHDIKNVPEFVEIKTEIRTKEEKNEDIKDELLEHKLIVESNIDVSATDTVIATDEISEIMKSSFEGNKMEDLETSNKDKTNKSDEKFE